MNSLFREEEVTNKQADVPWKKSETDRMLDWYFNGIHPRRIARAFGRSHEAVRTRIKILCFNVKDRAIKYQPFRRISRKGKRMTENEQIFIRSHAEKMVPVQVTAKVLMRDISELQAGEIKKEPGKIKSLRVIAPTLDLILAHRYIFHIYKTPVISDKTYDDLVKEEIEYGAGSLVLTSQQNARDCPRYIKSLALYLVDKHKEEVRPK